MEHHVAGHRTAAQAAAVEAARVQVRIRRVLVATQVLGGLGVGAGVTVTTLLAFELSGSPALAGLAASFAAFGAAFAAALIGTLSRHGRRIGLVTGYAIGTTGALTAVVSAVLASFPLMLVATFMFGASNASNFQARYAVTDLARPERRARDLSTVVWATTVGAVLGPNLTGPGAAAALFLGVPELSGPYLLSAAGFLAALAVMSIGLRPDPLVLARRLATEVAGPDAAPARRPGVREGLAVVLGVPAARAATATIASAQAVMIGVMVMTPVHMGDHGADIQLVGLTISLHIAGMFAFSPLFGRLTDRIGPRRALMTGFAQLTLSVLLASNGSPRGGPGFLLGLFLLGTGWSVCLIASSALLTEVLDLEGRPPAQAVSDLGMSLAGGAAGALSGLLMTLLGYPRMAATTLLLLLVPATMVVRDLRRTGTRSGGHQGIPVVAEV
jgi:MFS family permease